MIGLVLIVDPVATSRIFLRSTLESAHYEVSCVETVAEAEAVLSHTSPDLVLLSVEDQLSGCIELCRRITRSGVIATLKAAFGAPRPAAAGPVPVIAMSGCDRPAARLAILKAGATDVFDRPLSAGLLLARIRSILRNRDAMAEFAPVGDEARGFAEPEEEFRGPRRIVLLSRGDSALRPALDAATRVLPDRIDFRVPGSEVIDGDPVPPDLFVIDGSGAGLPPGDLLRLLSDLRSRPAARHSAQLVILPADTPDLAATALDIGANDVVSHMVSSAELSIRIRGLLRQKTQADRLRDRVRNGLRAAITDPLTGLHNRRFAMQELARLGDQAARSGTRLAAMVLDIDHFKRVNDRYGHSAGDRVLRGVAQALRAVIEPRGFVARIGGEEFLVALPDTTEQEAQTIADRLRRAVSARPVEVTQDAIGAINGACAETITRVEVPVTLSVGVALGSGETGTEAGIGALVARADTALYAAKTAGRDTVTFNTNAA